jgi:hypothetical protein
MIPPACKLLFLVFLSSIKVDSFYSICPFSYIYYNIFSDFLRHDGPLLEIKLIFLESTLESVATIGFFATTPGEYYRIFPYSALNKQMPVLYGSVPFCV